MLLTSKPPLQPLIINLKMIKKKSLAVVKRENSGSRRRGGHVVGAVITRCPSFSTH